MHGLIVIFYLPTLSTVFNKTLGTIGVGAGNGCAYRFNAYSVAIKRGWAEFNAHSGQRAAAYGHLSHTLHLRQALRHHRRRCVIHLTWGERIGGEGDN